MSKTITNEEYERLTKRDGQVDEYCKSYPRSMCDGWFQIFEQTAKPKQYRPTLDELVKVYAEGIGGRQFVSACCRDGLKAVIDKVFEGVSEEYTETPKAYYNISMQHRQGYKEE